jgi:malate dehydrogenase (oxaloacetate-decarboxylating)(NADP+)
MVDRTGVITKARKGELDPYKARFAQDTKATTLADAMKGADVFVGLSVAGVVTREMVAAMAKRPVIFALANPDPEILPEDIQAVRDDALIATGRTDYPNQVNNVLGFPFIFRGALDVRARSINEEMKMAATRALADLAKQDVPEAVAAAYGEATFRFGPDYLIPKPFDPRVLLYVAPAVAEAAIATGVARMPIDMDAYRTRLEARLGRRREVMRDFILKAQRNPKRIVFPEGENDRIIRAAAQVVEERIAKPVLLGRVGRIKSRAEALHVDLDGVEIVEHWTDEERRERYSQKLYHLRQRKGVTLEEAREIMRDATYFGCMMVREGDADGVIGGQEVAYPETIRPALEVVGTLGPGKHVAGLYMMVLQNELLFFADTTVNIDPDPATLAEITLLSSQFVRKLGIEPHVALLSFSNFGSARNPVSDKVREAVRLAKAADATLIVDGEMQADTAVVETILQKNYPFSTLQEKANVLIFPDLNSANIAYKLLWRVGGAEAIGPILLGMARPVHVLQRGSEAADIVNLTAIAVVDAQQRIQS